MDGLEAAEKILALNAGIPVVAMTANVMYDDKEFYKSNGMNDCVGKPFTSQELWQCLMKYFKPVSWNKGNAEQEQQSDSELRQKLINNFVKHNSGKYDEISAAIKTGDKKLAHRLAHTLKSNAGQLKKTALQHAAEDIEKHLYNEKSIIPRQMEALEAALEAALEELAPQVRQPAAPAADLTPLDGAAARELLIKLGPLLENCNTECLIYTDNLRLIPESADLIRHMESLDFISALKAYNALKINYTQ
jgi:HPt (histidine-containing phosphotransfer) domain-containing protein